MPITTATHRTRRRWLALPTLPICHLHVVWPLLRCHPLSSRLPALSSSWSSRLPQFGRSTKDCQAQAVLERAPWMVRGFLPLLKFCLILSHPLPYFVIEPLMEREFWATSMRDWVLLQLPQLKKYRPQLDSKGLGRLVHSGRAWGDTAGGVLSGIDFVLFSREKCGEGGPCQRWAMANCPQLHGNSCNQLQM